VAVDDPPLTSGHGDVRNPDVTVTRTAKIVFVGLQLGMVMSSMDGTIVATALPSITDDVGGFSRVTWVITAYALAQVVTMPLYGKLGDLLGRKRVLLSAVVLFILGSMACGVAQTMNQLLVARFLQGMGGGGIGAVAMAVTADIIPARQLGRYMGYQGLAFAVASVLGPVLGGLFVDHLSWRWAFYINVPFGLLAVGIIATQLRVAYRRLPHAVDWLGAALLMVGLAAFIVLSSTGGTDFGWTSGTAITYAAVIVAATTAFWFWERRAREPVLPLRLFEDPVIRGNAGVNFTSGLLLYCGIFFVPLFMQEVHGISPTSSGLVLTPVMFGAAFGTMISGRAVERNGRIRAWPVAGSVSLIAGMALLATLTESTPTALAALFVLLVGLGAGFVMQPSLLAIQNAAGPTDLGTATSTGLLFRMVGSTVGVPVFGGIVNAGIADGPRTAARFADALTPVFLAALPVAVLSLVIALRTPERELEGQPQVLAEPVV
jgi:EmrB/QacA subfamily drug resistance transporter